jgi:dihydropteroate synthase
VPGERPGFAALAAALRGRAAPLAAAIEALLDADARREWTWRLRGRTLPAGRRSLVMGVVNVTADSFSDGGRFLDPDDAVRHGLRLAGEGADLIDVGGESTRPGAERVPEEVERERVVPVVRALARRTDVPVSIDTTRAAVAEAAIEAGARVVNDVSGLAFDPALAEVAARSGAGLILMHMRGRPAEMQDEPRYDDLLAEVIGALRRSLEAALAAGVAADQVALDPGIGFGKRLPHNLALLRHLGALRALGRPLVVGASRKSFLGELTGRPAGERLAGSLAAAAAAIRAGAAVVRVHDVAETVDAVRVADAVRGGPA